jgi:hypothetical protein
LYRDINDFKKGYQPRINIVLDEKGDLVTDSQSILARWRNHFSQQLNIHGDNDGRQTEIHTAQPLVPESSAFEVELAIEKLKRSGRSRSFYLSMRRALKHIVIIIGAYQFCQLCTNFYPTSCLQG